MGTEKLNKQMKFGVEKAIKDDEFHWSLRYRLKLKRIVFHAKNMDMATRILAFSCIAGANSHLLTLHIKAVFIAILSFS
jgi:hypothetical protein